MNLDQAVFIADNIEEIRSTIMAELLTIGKAEIAKMIIDNMNDEELLQAYKHVNNKKVN